jgi:hypothetical protein
MYLRFFCILICLFIFFINNQNKKKKCLKLLQFLLYFRYMDIDSGEWVTACTTTTPSATASGLKPGHLYQFEVSAINKEGQSEPIYTGDPILAENPYSK